MGKHGKRYTESKVTQGDVRFEMGKHGKRYTESAKLVDPKALYSPADAVRLLTQMGRAKFDETVEVAIRLGIDSKQADQQIRGTVALPAGTVKHPPALGVPEGEKATEGPPPRGPPHRAGGRVDENRRAWAGFLPGVGPPPPL